MKDLISKMTGVAPSSNLWTPEAIEHTKNKVAILVRPGFLPEVDYWDNIIVPKSPWKEHNYEAVIRYGCTSSVKRGVPVLNRAQAIHDSYNKPKARAMMLDQGLPIVPNTRGIYPKIVRPKHHHRGKWFVVALNPMSEEKMLSEYNEKFGGAYSTDFIDKVAEYRIHATANNWLLLGQEKIQDPEWEGERDKYQFNANNGYIFVAMKFKKLKRFGFCCDAVRALGLDFGAVDVIEDKDGNLYILEVNTAPGSYHLLKKVYKEYFKAWESSKYSLSTEELPTIFLEQERREGIFAD